MEIKRQLKNADDMTALVNEIGFLPLFDVGVNGFSVEEMTRGQWWTGRADDPWHWREIAATQGEIIYGKIFNGRAGFVSRKWFPKFANYRRDGYDFDSRWEEGLEPPRNQAIMECVFHNPVIMTSDIKKQVGKTGFEGALTDLQMKTYLIIRGFDRKKNRFQEPYGWSIGVMDTPENAFGGDWATSAYQENPEKSYKDMIDQIESCLPGIDREALQRIMRR
ncbi:MAG: hypothetical protein E7322_09300 [Clostridiales bacterium]|nr:hypothetical protein [Clostridiales bacterium]